jgi:hypothetical protein
MSFRKSDAERSGLAAIVFDRLAPKFALRNQMRPIVKNNALALEIWHAKATAHASDRRK